MSSDAVTSEEGINQNTKQILSILKSKYIGVNVIKHAVLTHITKNS